MKRRIPGGWYILIIGVAAIALLIVVTGGLTTMVGVPAVGLGDLLALAAYGARQERKQAANSRHN